MSSLRRGQDGQRALFVGPTTRRRGRTARPVSSRLTASVVVDDDDGVDDDDVDAVVDDDGRGLRVILARCQARILRGAARLLEAACESISSRACTASEAVGTVERTASPDLVAGAKNIMFFASVA